MQHFTTVHTNTVTNLQHVLCGFFSGIMTFFSIFCFTCTQYFCTKHFLTFHLILIPRESHKSAVCVLCVFFRNYLWWDMRIKRIPGLWNVVCIDFSAVSRHFPHWNHPLRFMKVIGWGVRRMAGQCVKIVRQNSVGTVCQNSVPEQCRSSVSK